MNGVMNINFRANNNIVAQKENVKQNNVTPVIVNETKKQDLPKVSSSLLEAYMIKKSNKIAASELKDNKVVWKNDLKTLFNNNQAKILAIIPRTFNASDATNADGLIQMNLGEKTGKFLNAIEKLDEVRDMGINVLHILPIHTPGHKNAMGTAGSIYSPLDLLEIDPQLDDKNDPRTVEEEFKAFIDECHKRDIRVMLDLPSCASFDLYLAKPELMAKERNGVAKTPQGWGDIRMFEPWADNDKKVLNKALLDLHKQYVDKFIELGVDGIRADVSRAKPPEFWDVLIPYSRTKNPEFGWLAETYTYEDASPQLNMNEDRPMDALASGFDLFYGQYHIFNEWTTASELNKYVIENLDMSHELAPNKSAIGSFATHDDISPMFHGGANYVNLTTGLQATLPMVNPYFVDGVQSGDYYLYPYEHAESVESKTDTNECVVHRGKLDIFNHSRQPGGNNPEIGEFIKSTLHFRDKYVDLISKGSFIPLSTTNKDDKVIAYARHLDGKTLLVVANRNVNKFESAKINVPGLKADAKLNNLVASYGEKSLIQADDNILNVELAPARIHIFEIDTPNIEQSGLGVYSQNMS